MSAASPRARAYPIARAATYLTTFGVSAPQDMDEGTTLPFPLELGDAIPDGEVLAFPPDPDDERRPGWLFVTSGLSNPPHDLKTHGRYLGQELAIEAASFGEWPVRLLLQLAAYAHLVCEREIRVGDRIPCCFARRRRFLLGPAHGDPIPALQLPFGMSRTTETAAAIVWPIDTLEPWTLPTPGDRDQLQLLRLTTITTAELDLARSTSSAHLLLLLERLGPGRVSDPFRTCSTRAEGFAKAWAELDGLSEEEATARCARKPL